MKRFVFLLSFVCFCINGFSRPNPEMICKYGFTYEISMQKNWGYLQPVVLSVTPNTSADAAGLRVNDIIEKIDDKSTKGENIDAIINWMNNPNDRVQLTISNLKGQNQNRILDKYCLLNISITENDLAGIYSFYSLENVQTRAFTCPFKTTVNTENNLIMYESFGFTAPDSNNLSLDQSINATIQKCLEQKGLKYSETNPDLTIHTYYSYTPNPNFRSNSQENKLPVECRYNVNTNSMENLPIYYNPLIHSDQARYFLQIGIKLINKNSVSVWECEANELLQSNYPLTDYAEFHVPLMFMQYPYPKSLETAKFYYRCSTYNFTGISYNMDNLKEVSEVAPFSPAEKAGIKSGDVIEKINGIKLVNNIKTADNNYKQFIYKTLSYRDPATQFTNAEGFTRCMYWDKMKYALIQDEFRKPEFSTVFSYLFYFEPYINLSHTNIITFNIKRGRQNLEIKVKPVIYSEEMFVTGDM